MTTKSLFNSNEIAVFSDLTGQEIGKIEAKEGQFYATLHAKKKSIPWAFPSLKKAVSFIESASIKEQGTISKEPIIHNQLKLF